MKEPRTREKQRVVNSGFRIIFQSVADSHGLLLAGQFYEKPLVRLQES